MYLGDDLRPEILIGQRLAFGGLFFTVSCDIWDSDIKTTTLLSPIRVVQYAPKRPAFSAGQPLRIFLEIFEKLCL